MSEVRKLKEATFEVVREGLHPRTFDVVILAAGASMNTMDGRPIYYPEELLSSPETAALFEGATVNAHRFGNDFDHVQEEDKSLFAMNTVGVLEGVHFGEGALRGRLVLHEGADFMAGLLKLSVERDEPLVGLSIDATGNIQFTAREGVGDVAEVTAFGPSPTVDVVSRPAAGGEIVRIAASMSGGENKVESHRLASEENDMSEQNPTPPEANNEPKAVDLEALKASVMADLRAEAEEKRKAREKAKAEVRAKIAESQKLLETKLKESNLSEKAQAVVRKQYADSTFEEADLDETIAGMREVLTESDRTGNVSVPDISVGTETRDRIDAAYQHLFCKNGYKGLREEATKELRESGADPIRSFLGFHRDAFGVDLQKASSDSNYRRKSLKESLTTASWAEIFGDNLHKAMIRFSEDPMFQSWRDIATVESLSSYETQYRIRDYGFGNLSTVSEGENYPALTSPGDDQETYSATKKGGTEDITEEMILADQLGRIAAIPGKLGTAAARTLYEAVWDNLTISGQPTLADSNALFYARTSPNGNLGTTALSAAQFIATWKLMLKYTDTSTSKRLGITPAYLAVPVDLANTAYEMFKDYAKDWATTSRSFEIENRPQIITVRHWTNTKDHVYIAAPSQITGVIVGFVQGNEQPQLFVQDMKDVGSVFDADKITYKIKYPFGVGIGSYQAFYAQDVA